MKKFRLIILLQIFYLNCVKSEEIEEEESSDQDIKSSQQCENSQGGECHEFEQIKTSSECSSLVSAYWDDKKNDRLKLA